VSGSVDKRVENVDRVRVKAFAENASRRRKSALVRPFYLVGNILRSI
jgi:hypothetical protein